MSAKKQDPKVNITFLGGNNEDKIGGSCALVEIPAKEKTYRFMIDLGAKFIPYDTGYNSIFADIEDYFQKKDAPTQAKKPLDGIFFTHGHLDHIGGIAHVANMGFEMPPIYASEFVGHKISDSFYELGLENPKIRPFNNKMKIKFGNNIEVEAVSMPHTALESLGVHVMAKAEDNEQSIGLMHYGDFFVSQNSLAKEEALESYNDLKSRKPITHAIIDSTSLTNIEKTRLSFEEIVTNVLEEINLHKGKTIISPVISGSLENMAIDVEAARRLGKKIYLDGRSLKNEYKNMLKSGYNNFEDVIYTGSLHGYLKNTKPSEQYFVCSGAFAQGMEEYEKNIGENNNIWLSSAVKMALGLSEVHQAGKSSLFLMRQRDIPDITGKYGLKMLNLIAAKGASVVCSPAASTLNKFKTKKMQESGHLLKSEFEKIYDDNITYISSHGNAEQRKEASKTMARMSKSGKSSHFCPNMQTMSLNADGSVVFDAKIRQQFWTAVKRNNISTDPNIAEIYYKYCLVSDVDYQKVYDVCEISQEQRQIDRKESREKANKKGNKKQNISKFIKNKRQR